MSAKKMRICVIVVFLVYVDKMISEEKFCLKEKGCTEDDDESKLLTRDLKDDDAKGDKRKASFLDVNNLPTLDNELYLIGENEYPQVMWWYDHIFPHRNQDNKIKCSLGTCTVTADRRELTNPLTRGFIFYGTSFYANDLPLPRLPHHEWALIHEESPKNNWMYSDELGISLFNHTGTFRRESDYPISTQFIRDPEEWFEDTYFVSTKEKNRLQKEEGLAPVVFLQRDCNPPSDRDTYIAELMKYIDIDSFGKCLNNKKMPDEINGFHKLSTKEYYHFLARYKFQIAFENAVCQDYMTEKVFRPLTIGSVPVYYGSPLIRDFMPSDKAVIMATDFESPQDLAKYLKELNENDTKYDEYLKHRKIGKIDNPAFEDALKRQPWKLPHRLHKPNFGHYMFKGFSCYVCDQLHERNNMLRQHLSDPKKPIKALKMGKANHMGCPRPFPIIPSSTRNSKQKFHVKDYANFEALALQQMLLANETDNNNWRNYLKMNTDKYPKNV